MAKKRKYTKTQQISGDVRSRKFNGKWYDAMGLYVRKSDAIKGQKRAIEKDYLTRLTSHKGRGKFGGNNYWRLFIRKK